MDLADKLQVKVIEAENLINVKGLPPSPYVELVVGQNIKRIKEKKETNNPVWNAPPIIFEHVLGDGLSTILAYVYHSDEFQENKLCLGVAIIPLDTFYHSPEVEVDYWFDMSATSEMSDKVDRSRLRLQVLYDNDMDADMYPQVTESTSAPNLLQVTVHGASELNTKSAIEALVECQVGNLRKETKLCKKSMSPVWNELLEIPVTDGGELVTLTLKASALMRSVFVGHVRIAMNEVAAAGDVGVTRLFTLLNEQFEFGEVNRGELNLTARWVFDQATYDLSKRVVATRKKSIFRKIGKLISGARRGVGSSSEVEHKQEAIEEEQEVRNKLYVGAQYDMSPMELSEYLEEQRDKRLEEVSYLLEQKQEEEEDEMPEGDYTIQVNVVEVSDLVGLNASGNSDPVITAEVMGLKRTTSPKKETNSAYFDETLYFNFKDLRRDQLAEASVKISVFDWNRFRRWDLIGVYSVDLPSVYSSKDHEIHRKWVSLRDPTNANETGSQGLLKFSAVCLGPGDVQKVHDPALEDDDEHDVEATEGTGVVGDSHGASQTLQFLVLSLVRAEGLPGFDRFISTMKSGLYTYAQVEFAGCKPIKTTKIAVSGKRNLSVKFDEELWIPVWVPSMSRRAAITLMNREMGRKDQVIATAYIDFEEVVKYDKNPVVREGVLSFAGGGTQVYKGQNLQWIHFYGANSLVRSGAKEALFMNRFPNHASAYRGSLLAGIRVVKDTSGSSHGEAAHRLRIDYEIPENVVPAGALYMLRVMVYQGSDFGSKGTQASSKGAKFALGISIGPHETMSAFRTYEDGAVDWLQLIEMPDLPLPKEYKMLPDVFITVFKGTEKAFQSVAFTRIRAIDILPKGSEPAPRWYEFKHDVSHRSTSTVGYPGSGLLRISLSNIEDVEQQVDWEPERRKLEIRQPYCLRVLVYQCRNLPAVDDNGLIDPYIKVRFAGQKKKTQIRRMTQSPCYYESMDFTQQLPQDLSLAPHILVQLWDGKTLSHVPIAALRQAVVTVPQYSNVHSAEIPTPTWRKLTGIDGKKELGEVLIAFQLFAKSSAKQVVPMCRDITPLMKKAYIDLHLVGLRGLTFRGKSNVKNPSLQLDIGGGRVSTFRHSSKSSRVPSATNPNFLDRQCVMIDLPEEPLYMPSLEIKCFDERISGKVLLGAATVDLQTKVPWNVEEYVEPRHHEVIASNDKERKAQGRKKSAPKEIKRVKNSVAEQNKRGNEQDLMTFDDDDDISSDEAEDQRVLEDSGVGVFPPEIGAREHGSKYLELPVIVDQDQQERERERLRLEEERAENLLGLGADSDFSKVLDDHSRLDVLKKIVGIPTAWVNADFLKGREWWMQSKVPGEGGELERYLKTYPFENYPIFTGHIAFNKFGKRKNTVKRAGLLKAVVRVCVKNPRYDEEYGLFARSIRQVTACKVRVYVIKAMNLHYSEGMFGGAPDPYLCVSLESQVRRDRRHVVKNSTSPEFFECYEFDTKLPGPSLLRLQILDKNYLTSDKGLGETVIDLEDRWFHPKWTERGELKPCEVRTLYKDSSQSAQGAVMLWVDIIPQSDVLKFPKVEISGPEPMKFELRIVCWRSLNVKVYGQKSLDLFATFFMDGGDKHKQSTDTHWFCKSGAGSWNWRIKIPIELPIKARELGRLKVQMWEKNVITSNTMVGESSVSLFDWFMLAYRRQTTSVSPFKELRDAEMKRNSAGFSLQQHEEAEDLLADLPSAGVDDPHGDNSGDEQHRQSDDENSEEDCAGDGDIETGGGAQGEDSDSAPLLGREHSTSKSKRGSVLSGNRSVLSGSKTVRSQQHQIKTTDSRVSAQQQDSDEDEEVAAMLKNINTFLGRGEDIPEDAEWLTLTYHDRAAGKVLDRGKLAISICIVPESEVITKPAGHGRSEPNDNPYLPQPFGRFSFSWNPWKVLSGLCGVKTLCLLLCVCCCLFTLAVFMFVSTYLSGIEAIIEMVERAQRDAQNTASM